MTKNLITVNEYDSVAAVASKFKAHGFHHLPVLNQDQDLTGIISTTDIERLRLGASLFKSKNQDEYNAVLFESLIVKSVMCGPVISLTVEDDIAKAYSIFKQNRFRALPILDKDQLVGMITPLDLLDHFFTN